MQKQLVSKKLERDILKFFSSGKPKWYWAGADHFEPETYAKEQEKYGATKYDMAIDKLEDKGLIKTVRKKGASNAEYYKITNKGKQVLHKELNNEVEEIAHMYDYEEKMPKSLRGK